MRVPGRVVVSALLLTAACAADAPRHDADSRPLAATTPLPATVHERDGVTLLEHGAAAFDRAPRLAIAPTPLATLGGADGDAAYDLTSAGEVVLLADGRLATLAPMGGRLLVFRADGRGDRIVGRPGRGPGEFMAPAGPVRLSGDTLLVLDRANRRLTRILADAGIVAERSLPALGALDVGATPVGVLPGGGILTHTAGWSRSGVPDSVVRQQTPLVVVDRESGAGREIARVPDFEQAMVETRFRGRRRLEPRALRFTPFARVAVWDTLIASGPDDGYDVPLRAADGRVVARLRVAVPRRPVTRAMREALVAAELARFDARGDGERGVDAAESRRLLREAPFADLLPSFDALFVTRGGTLWVVDARAPTDTGWTATAFRRDGAIVGRLAVAGAGYPVAFDDGRVVIRSEDDVGLVTLRVYRMEVAGER